MGMEPVALQGRNQGVDPVRNPGGERRVGDGQKGEGHGKRPDDAGLEFHLPEEINESDAPGKEDEGFIHVGKRGVAETQPVGLDPAGENGDGVKR